MSDQSGMSAMTERGALDMAIATLQGRVRDRDAEIVKLRAAVEDAVETLEAMNLHDDNALYDRLRAVLEPGDR